MQQRSQGRVEKGWPALPALPLHVVTADLRAQQTGFECGPSLSYLWWWGMLYNVLGGCSRLGMVYASHIFGRLRPSNSKKKGVTYAWGHSERATADYARGCHGYPGKT